MVNTPKKTEVKPLKMEDAELDALLGRNDNEEDVGDDFPEVELSAPGPDANTFRKTAARKSNLRSTESRAKTWMPPSHLPDAPQINGWRHRWCRYIAGNQSDDVNMSTRMREGYEPVKRSDENYSEIVRTLGFGFRSDHTDLIITGGHILCRIPDEVAEGRQEYYQDQALSQLKSTKTKAETFGDGETRIKMSVEEFKTKVSRDLFE